MAIDARIAGVNLAGLADRSAARGREPTPRTANWNGVLSEPLSRRRASNQPWNANRTSSDWFRPSWPPDRQITLTGVPWAAIPRALASASVSGNSESCSPWMSSVGAVIEARTLARARRAQQRAHGGIWSSALRGALVGSADVRSEPAAARIGGPAAVRGLEQITGPELPNTPVRSPPRSGTAPAQAVPGNVHAHRVDPTVSPERAAGPARRRRTSPPPRPSGPRRCPSAPTPG